MKYRWGKGKKDGGYLPNGDKIIHLTVGGRTSAVVPSVQKKTGAVAGETALEDEDSSNADSASSVEDVKPKASKGRKRKSDVKEEEADAQNDIEKKPSKSRRTTKATKQDDEKPKVNGTKKAPLKRKNTVAEHAVDDLPGEPAEEELEPLKSKGSKRKSSSTKATPKSSEETKGDKAAPTKTAQRHPKAKADEKRFGKQAEAPAEAEREAPSGRRRSARMSARAG